MPGLVRRPHIEGNNSSGATTVLYLVLAILLVGFTISGLILLSSRSKVDGAPRDLRRAGDDEPGSPGGAFRRAFGRTAWMMHGPS